MTFSCESVFPFYINTSTYKTLVLYWTHLLCRLKVLVFTNMVNNFFNSTRGKHLFELADCVSLQADFFGKDFQKLLIDTGETKIIGRVIEVEEYGNLSVQWDCNNTVQQHVSKSKLTHEPSDTPQQSLTNYLQPTSKAVQSPTSVILAEDIPSNIYLNRRFSCWFSSYSSWYNDFKRGRRFRYRIFRRTEL